MTLSNQFLSPGTTTRMSSTRRRSTAALGVLLFVLAGCTTSVEIEEPGLQHPANPAAPAAPVARLPDTLDTTTVQAPEKDTAPHAGHEHRMH